MIHEHDDEDGCIDGAAAMGKDGSVLRAQLIRYVMQLSDETRAKLLAFLHLTDDLRDVEGRLIVNRDGETQMTLFRDRSERAQSRSAPGSGAEPLQ